MEYINKKQTNKQTILCVTLVLTVCHTFLIVGTSAVARKHTLSVKPLSGQKYPDASVWKILSIEELDGRVQLNTQNWRLRR